MHPQYPDDLQALFFFPAARRVEQIWVRLERDRAEHGAYEGLLLNTAHSDPSVAAGGRVVVRPTPGARLPVWLSPTVEQNLRDWSAKCTGCGFDLVLEPVDAIAARQFQGAGAGVTFEALTTRCSQCGATQMLERRGGALEARR